MLFRHESVLVPGMPTTIDVSSDVDDGSMPRNLKLLSLGLWTWKS